MKNNSDVIRNCYVLRYKISGPLSYPNKPPPFRYCQYNQYLSHAEFLGEHLLQNIFLDVLLVFPYYCCRKSQICWQRTFRIYHTKTFDIVLKFNIIRKIISSPRLAFLISSWWSFNFSFVPLGQLPVTAGSILSLHGCFNSFEICFISWRRFMIACFYHKLYFTEFFSHYFNLKILSRPFWGSAKWTKIIMLLLLLLLLLIIKNSPRPGNTGLMSSEG